MHFGTIHRPVHTALKRTVTSYPFSSSHQIRNGMDSSSLVRICDGLSVYMRQVDN